MPPALLSSLLQGKRGEQASEQHEENVSGSTKLESAIPKTATYLHPKTGKLERTHVEKGNESCPGYSPAAVWGLNLS